jgi:hypothetical protein
MVTNADSVACGSGMFIQGTDFFSIPDHGCRISDPGCNNNKK